MRTAGRVLAGAAVAALVCGIAFDGDSAGRGPSAHASEGKISAEGWPVRR
ncbi:hypothetical protein [Streptomyces cyaneofuscatus]